MDSRGNDGSRALAIDVSGAPACVIGEHRWIPAFAGMTVRSDSRIGVDGIIPAFAGMTAVDDQRARIAPKFPARQRRRVP